MKLKTAIEIAFIFYIISFVVLVFTPKKGAYIKVIDVGQGDAIFIRGPENETMLIDGGGNYQVDQALKQEMPLMPCHLNYLVITHPHADHVKGLEKVLKRCSVDIVMFNDVSYGGSSLDDFRRLLEKNKVINVFAGDEFSFGKAKIKILWPTQKLIQSGIKNLNDVSVVLLLDYGNFEALFTGDLEEDYQANIDISGFKNLIDGRLEVLKVAHHGSINGVYLPLIQQLSPENCVVSVGANNTFGHPNKKAIADLVAAGCSVLRTDLIGDVVIPIN